MLFVFLFWWCCAGDYDALHVVMLLPRILFKSELVVSQLRQQVCVRARVCACACVCACVCVCCAYVCVYLSDLSSVQHKFEEVLEKQQPLSHAQGDLVVFAANLISKVTCLQQLVQQVQR